MLLRKWCLLGIDCIMFKNWRLTLRKWCLLGIKCLLLESWRLLLLRKWCLLLTINSSLLERMNDRLLIGKSYLLIGDIWQSSSRGIAPRLDKSPLSKLLGSVRGQSPCSGDRLRARRSTRYLRLSSRNSFRLHPRHCHVASYRKLRGKQASHHIRCRRIQRNTVSMLLTSNSMSRHCHRVAGGHCVRGVPLMLQHGRRQVLSPVWAIGPNGGQRSGDRRCWS